MTRNCWFHLLLIFAFLLSLPASAATAPGATTQRKLLKINLSEDRRTATVLVPPGCNSLRLQRYQPKMGWQKVSTRPVTSGWVRIKLPPSSRQTRWRAVGMFPAVPSAGKFPPRFYAGQNRFDPVPPQERPGPFNRWWAAADTLGPSYLQGTDQDGGGNLPQAPIEADIWVNDGPHVFFFNQLRGLQVLDVSNPSDPRLLATRRIHAEGENLYLVPGAGNGHHLLLITSHHSPAGEPFTRFRLIRFSSGKLTTLYRQNVPGMLADSRMVGQRLILATTTWKPVNNPEKSWLGGATTHLSEWIIRPEQPLAVPGEFTLPGDNPMIAAGHNWLAVAVTPADHWELSDVTVFSLSQDGLIRLTGQPVRTAGCIADKFKIHWHNHVLTTICERDDPADWEWNPTTVLENFRVWGPGIVTPAVIRDRRMSRLELAKGESLHATRFAENKAYIVTFLQTDPLWIIDLSDPTKPAIAGHLEVPGWSTYLEPIGDLLFSVGFESGTVAASLFDVADPASPKLLRRVNLGTEGSSSEATWDEQALRVIPSAGLAMIPVSSQPDGNGQPAACVQLLDLDLKARDLKPRGTIRHEFDARRATVIGQSVVSISQRVMVTASLANRDKPVIQSEVSLAWPVDFVVDAGNHLIQIEAGTAWQQGRATARLSSASNTEAILSETDLGNGIVRDAAFSNGRLVVLRETGTWLGIYPLTRNADSTDPARRLHLDVYQLEALSQLVLKGTCWIGLEDGQSLAGKGLYWPGKDRPCLLLHGKPHYGWGNWRLPPPGLVPLPIRTLPFNVLHTQPETASAEAVATTRFAGKPAFPGLVGRPPQLVVFDLTDPTAPVPAEPLALGSQETCLNNVADAADGVLVVGAQQPSEPQNDKWVPFWSSIASMFVVEVPPTGPASFGASIDLPGDLIGVTELDRNGFLAFSRSRGEKGGLQIQASSCDGSDAFLIASLETRHEATAIDGRRVFVATKGAITSFELTDQGEFVEKDSVPIHWMPDSLRVTGGVLIGSSWNRLLSWPLDQDAIRSRSFQPGSINFGQITTAANRDLLVPLGPFGARRLEP